jgi:hypothetical protein
MTRFFFMAALLAAAGATAAIAQGQSKVLVLIGHPVDNQFYFGHNADDPAILSQRVIPSKKGLRGVSFEESIIKPDSSVNNQNPIKAFVTTANYPNGSPLDVGPVEDIQLDGGQPIDHFGQDPDVANAIMISTQHARVRNAKIRRWHGMGVQLAQPTAALGIASRRIENSVIQECHIGVWAVSDTMLFNNDIIACRDYGVFSGNLPAGNVLISDCHIYGCNGETEEGEFDGKAVYLANGSGWRIAGCTIADSHFGLALFLNLDGHKPISGE